MKTLEYIVSEENKYTLCDEIADSIVEFAGKYIKDKKEILRYRLSAEECLLNWIEGKGKDSDYTAIGKKLTFTCGKKSFRKPFFELGFEGDVFNPYITEHEVGVFGESALRTLGIAPTYSHFGNANYLKYDIQNNGESTLKILFYVILSSLAVGNLGRLFLPASVISAIQTSFIDPVYGTFFDILNCIAGPMIFLSVAWGVYGIGDASTLSKVGKKMLGVFVGNDFLIAILGVITFPIFGLTLAQSSSSGTKFGEIFGMILGFFPPNIVQPFIDGNTLQIIFLAIAVGIGLLYLGKRTEGVAIAIEQVNYLVQLFMELISKIVPFFIFVVIVSLLWSDNSEVLKSSWQFFAILLSGIFLICLGFLLFTAIKQKASVVVLFKKFFPSFLVALSTASSAATFNTNMEACDKKLGINHALSSFGVPLAMVISNPIATFNNLSVAFFFAKYFNVETSVSWVITAVIVCSVVAVASPPIPGGGALAYTMLFLQLGIPEEALALVLAIDMLTDFFITSGEMFCLLPTMVNVSAKIGFIDYDILRADVSEK